MLVKRFQINCTNILSISIAIFSVLLGIIISYVMNVAPGGTSFLTSVTAYGAAISKVFQEKNCDVASSCRTKQDNPIVLE